MNAENRTQVNRSPLRIFLSSTAIDMQEHRHKVSEGLTRLDHLPVKMEAFGAIPNEPVSVCKTKVLQSNALVVMVAHRYGWVPTPEEGGDGKKSITWIEVETAMNNDLPVFAFIVDPGYGWTRPKEQDLIAETTDEKKFAEIIKNVQALKEFKNFLDSKAGLTRDKFTTPEDLALKVTTSLAGLQRHLDSGNEQRAAKRPDFVFRVVHALQPAPHFKGRKHLLGELKNWWDARITPDRVRSLVAIGGSGKTAIVERFLSSISKEPLRGSVLVWSFYDEPNTDAFLREACIVFTGAAPEGEGGKLESLQRALAAGNGQNLIVLDGMERVQSEGKGSSGRAKGDLEDHRVKNLLRTIAGGLGNTRALVTSRFKLTDLTQWENAGYKSHELDVLDKETSIEVLKAWGIKGDDEKLSGLALLFGRHALSVSVLGSYLNHYCNCNPDGLKEFNLDEIFAEEPLAARLARILSGYAKSLTDQERDLLVRISIFPKGVSVDILGYLIDAGAEISGALNGVNQVKLSIIAEKLKQQGLIYSYNRASTQVYTAHPFLREYFRNLLGVKPEEIYEVVRNKLAIGLDTKPVNKPNEVTILDKYEQLIEHNILAGQFDDALELYENAMGETTKGNHLYTILGDYGRMIRIAALFSDDATPLTLKKQLSNGQKGDLLSLWGLASVALGDLRTAHSCFNLAIQIAYQSKDAKNVAWVLQYGAWINIYRGLFPSVKELLESSIDYMESVPDNEEIVKFLKKANYAYMGYTCHFLGEMASANRYFLKAASIYGGPLSSILGIYEAEHLIDLGEKEKANQLVKANLLNMDVYSPKDTNLCHYILGILSLPDNIPEARSHLQKIREWTDRSGYMESIILSHILAAEIAYFADDYSSALAEAETGLSNAESCGFGKLAIELLLLLSKIHQAIPDYTVGLSHARQALDRSELPECNNEWGKANGLYLCGVCHKGLGEYALAKMRLADAAIVWEKIQHPEMGKLLRLIEELEPME